MIAGVVTLSLPVFSPRCVVMAQCVSHRHRSCWRGSVRTSSSPATLAIAPAFRRTAWKAWTRRLPWSWLGSLLETWAVMTEWLVTTGKRPGNGVGDFVKIMAVEGGFGFLVFLWRPFKSIVVATVMSWVYSKQQQGMMCHLVWKEEICLVVHLLRGSWLGHSIQEQAYQQTCGVGAS